MYTKMIFTNADIQFISINNSVDSDNLQDSDFTPFLNIINEWYTKDTSKKIRAVLKAKGEAGKPLCTNQPYGYVKDPKDKRHQIIKESAANVVCKYTDITKLTAKIIKSFVERIDVYKPEKVPETRTKKYTICIHWCS